MKNLVLILLLAISYQLLGQKNYRIEKCLWNYTQPTSYVSKVDNFENEIKTGQEYIKNQEDGTTFSNDDTILFSIAKSDTTQVNIALASYRNNGNIQRFTLKGYAEKLGEYFKVNPKNDNPKVLVSVEVSEITIDKKKFYLVSK